MKKILFFAAMALLLAGCSKDKLSLNKNSVELHAEEEVQLTANGTVEWYSDNEYVATVDEQGLVTANFCGEAVITAQGIDGVDGKATCAVKVTPRYYTYTEPLLRFGCPRSAVKAYEQNTLLAEEGDYLLYESKETGVLGIIYYFESDLLYISGVVVDYSILMNVTYFLTERYLPVENVGTTYYFINGLPTSFDMMIGFNVDTDMSMVMYISAEEGLKSSGTPIDRGLIEKVKGLYRAAL